MKLRWIGETRRLLPLLQDIQVKLCSLQLGSNGAWVGSFSWTTWDPMVHRIKVVLTSKDTKFISIRHHQSRKSFTCPTQSKAPTREPKGNFNKNYSLPYWVSVHSRFDFSKKALALRRLSRRIKRCPDSRIKH
jgi:hypothetical protein